LQGAADRHEAAIDVQALAQLFEGGIGLLVDEFAELLELVGVESRKSSAAMGLGFNRAGFATALQQSHDEGRERKRGCS
jgi:hypothetical protein